MTKSNREMMAQAIKQQPKSNTWAQVELKAMEDMAALNKASPRSCTLLLMLASRLREGSGGIVMASRKTMAEMLSCSVPTVERALRVLIEDGWVKRVRVGNALALAINTRVAWVGPRGDLRFAEFPATVIASRSEQNEADLADDRLPRQTPIIGRDEQPMPVGDGTEPPSQPMLEGMEPVIYRDGKTGRHYTRDGEEWQALMDTGYSNG